MRVQKSIRQMKYTLLAAKKNLTQPIIFFDTIQ